MKTARKMLTVLLALVMTFAMSITAFAADTTHTITITSKTAGHTYEAYQVFAGTYDKSSGKLSNITWGSGVAGSALLAALQADTTLGSKFTGCKSAEDVANVISDTTKAVDVDAFAAIVAQHLGTTKTASTTTDGATYTITGLEDGYYFVNEDKLDSTVGTAYTKYMLQVVGDVKVAAKTDVPTVTKKVLEKNDASYKDTWNDAADYSIGDEVSFRLTGLVPDMSNYKTYVYQFNDTLSSGLTFTAGSVKVYYATGDSMTAVNGSTATGAGGKLIDAANYTVKTTDNGFTLSFADLKTVSGVAAGDYIVVEYSAALNSTAVIGNPGNPNEVTLTYSNNPNNSGSGTPTTGTTPKDEVVVFTFNLPVNKTDKTGNALSGATFALFASKADADVAATDSTKLDNALKFTGSDGTYTYNAKSGTVNTLTDKDGKYSIQGLDQGTYYLVEVAAPAGYNKLTTAQEVKIVPTYDEKAYKDGHVVAATNDQLTAVKISLNGGTAAEAAIIVNASGSTLPTTGGIGTTIFTVGGMILMLAAAILLIVRKKLSREEN